MQVVCQYIFKFVAIQHKLKIQMENKVAVGIDIGGTNTVIGIVDQAGNVFFKTSIPTPAHGDFEKYISDLSGEVKKLITDASEADKNLSVMGIGIGAPIGNYHTGTIDFATNLSFKGRLPVVETVRSHFPEMPVIVLTNDANAAAMGEMMMEMVAGVMAMADAWDQESRAKIRRGAHGRTRACTPVR